METKLINMFKYRSITSTLQTYEACTQITVYFEAEKIQHYDGFEIKILLNLEPDIALQELLWFFICPESRRTYYAVVCSVYFFFGSP